MRKAARQKFTKFKLVGNQRMNTDLIIQSLEEKAEIQLKKVAKAKAKLEAAMSELISAERDHARTVAYIDRHLLVKNREL